MSAPGRRMDSPKGVGMDACGSLWVPFVSGRSIVLPNAHMVDTHSCRPSFRPSHIVLFTGRSAQSLLAAESLSASPFCGPHAAVSVRETTWFFQAASPACARCHCRNRFQHISASFLAAATRAIFALDRLRMRL